jgi:phage-related tail fiber protein
MYSNLYAAIGTKFGSGDGSTTFVLPDLRGEFIRGWSDSKEVDKNRSFGSLQMGSIIATVGYIDNITDNSKIYATAFQREFAFTGETFDDGFEADIIAGQTRNGITYLKRDQLLYTRGTILGNISTWNAYKGTRPRNIALLACIKY